MPADPLASTGRARLLMLEIAEAVAAATVVARSGIDKTFVIGNPRGGSRRKNPLGADGRGRFSAAWANDGLVDCAVRTTTCTRCSPRTAWRLRGPRGGGSRRLRRVRHRRGRQASQPHWRFHDAAGRLSCSRAGMETSTSFLKMSFETARVLVDATLRGARMPSSRPARRSSSDRWWRWAPAPSARGTT